MKFDLAAAEQQMRDNIAQAQVEGTRMVEAGKADATFLAAQRLFDEARIQFTLACMKAETQGMDRNVVLSAAGHAMGQQWGSSLMGCIGARERAVLNGWLQQGLGAVIGVKQAEKTLTDVFSSETIQ